jgi:hypothetical protein
VSAWAWIALYLVLGCVWSVLGILRIVLTHEYPYWRDRRRGAVDRDEA